MSGRVNITAISYLNTLPFVYGIKHADNYLRANVILNVPSSCHNLLNENKADIALMPVANLSKVYDINIITDYCIGATRGVRTVALMSNVPLNQIKKIYLDNHSSTSATLIRILAREKWKIDVEWVQLISYKDQIKLNSCDEGYMLIGDKVFDYEDQFEYITDLSDEWNDHTSMPFVFAVWVAKKYVSQQVVDSLNKALKYGVDNREKSLYGTPFENNFARSLNYITNNISYELDKNKIDAISTFLHKAKLGGYLASPD